MKNKFLSFSIMFLLALSPVLTTIAQKSSSKKIKKKKDKGSNVGTFIAATILAATAGSGLAAYLYIKAENALQKADIAPDSHTANKARQYLYFYGPFGINLGTKLLFYLEDAKTLAYLVTSNEGKALAIYWDTNRPFLAGRLGVKGTKVAVQGGVDNVKEGVQKIKGLFNH